MVNQLFLLCKLLLIPAYNVTPCLFEKAAMEMIVVAMGFDVFGKQIIL